jgi:HD-GYP domain-containing protein (c-di-GMP phosphodiesterase class II)
MNLTGTEQGISTDASGQRMMADVGTAEMINVPLQALFEFTKEAAQINAPVVRNDGFNLPDGSQLVNLAAVPVVVRGELTGVIMVANKRSGPFTEEDTDMLLAVGKHAGVALENRRLHLALEEACRSTIAVLADAIEAKDPYTRGHCEGVASLAVRVAKRLGLTREEMDDVRYAALLHDVGKIGVSDGILLKPGRLLPEEFQVIQRHSEIGSDLISRVPALSHIAPYIRHHHERMDGKGYPAALAGDQIPIAARIISVVDAFDAMTSPRPYRDAIDRDHAVIELQRCSGDQFDPQVVEACLAVLDEEGASVPSEVRPLTPEDGSIGIEVIRQGEPTRAGSAGVQ